MRKLREYIFYRVYETVFKKTRKVDEAVSNATYIVDIYNMVFAEAIFFLLKGVFEFDMTHIAFYYLEYKKVIVIAFIIISIVWTYIIDKKIRKRVANGWIKELKAKYHKDSYCVSTVWIILFPFIMVLGVPIIYGILKGTLRLTDTHTGEILWSI